MAGASTVGVWGWTDKPGTLAHWPGASSSAFPRAHRERYARDGGRRHQSHLQALSDVAIRMTLKDDYVTDLQGEGADAMMMRAYLAAWATVKPMRCPMSASA